MGEKTIPDETIKKVHEYYKALNELGEHEHETARISEHAMGKQRMGIERANSTSVQKLINTPHRNTLTQ